MFYVLDLYFEDKKSGIYKGGKFVSSSCRPMMHTCFIRMNSEFGSIFMHLVIGSSVRPFVRNSVPLQEKVQ